MKGQKNMNETFKGHVYDFVDVSSWKDSKRKPVYMVNMLIDSEEKVSILVEERTNTTLIALRKGSALRHNKERLQDITDIGTRFLERYKNSK